MTPNGGRSQSTALPDTGEFTKMTETHVSWLVFVGDHVYKIKKPVRFDFVDLRDESARTRACRAEVELNRRLSPDVYEGVGTFSQPNGQVEPVVVMRRLPDERRLAVLVAEDDPDLGRQIDWIAATLAGFHRQAERGSDIDRDCGPAATRRLWQTNLAEMRTIATGVLAAGEIDLVQQLSEQYLVGREELFDRRVAAAHAVDGHGDLLADDIFCLEDGPRLLDCLEFSDTLRHVDTLSDVASLAMDIERLGRADLAARLLGAYTAASGDSWPASLAHLYIAYRATVRAKVACIQAHTGHPQAAVLAQELMNLARRHLESGAVRLVLIGGLPGTGKSSLAQALNPAAGWTVLRSDEVRKELAGQGGPGAAPLGMGIYQAEMTAAVYSELLGRSERLLRTGQSVVLDASWMRRCWRDAARTLGARTNSRLVELRCHAPAPIAESRILRRANQGHDPSDATAPIARAMALTFEPWPEATTIDTTGSPGQTLATALAPIQHLDSD